jgi:hypothetical protein
MWEIAEIRMKNLYEYVNSDVHLIYSQPHLKKKYALLSKTCQYYIWECTLRKAFTFENIKLFYK